MSKAGSINPTNDRLTFIPVSVVPEISEYNFCVAPNISP